jgi:hypothetical protein
MTESKVTVEQLAKAALDLDNLLLRALTQEFLRQNPLVNVQQRQDLRRNTTCFVHMAS